MKKDKEGPHSSSCFVAEIALTLAPKLQKDLKDQNFILSKPPYTIFSAKKSGISCTLYESGKITVQGKEMGPFLEFYLEPEILQTFSYTHPETTVDQEPHSGVDESGKGDFFGPLCIATVFSQGAETTKLKMMGVKDSKNLSESSILKLAKQIRANYPHHIIRISPKRYNELYLQFRNLNTLLGWGHATAIEHIVLKSGCIHVTIDQFAAEHVVMNALKKKHLEVALSQRHRAEEDVVVAAASILARAAFVEDMQIMSAQLGIVLPFGCSAATKAAGKKVLAECGKDTLDSICKMHFKTYQEIVQE